MGQECHPCSSNLVKLTISPRSFLSSTKFVGFKECLFRSSQVEVCSGTPVCSVTLPVILHGLCANNSHYTY
ncbi:hypothetical protein Ae201684_004565 [Aphanomyces euteiches]|uniref:Uncharacterized protein n=1 Tax=Aphanomyces euteiches TaxID=100861 RepID=A0A6G0XHV4_9STRA|nr:hypothetical protein Ae201684_004565 [Aphanomyces euteiches]